MIPQWKLERFVLGELPPSELESVANLIAQNPVEQERIAAISASNAQFLDQFDPATAAKRITAMASAKRETSTPRNNGHLWLWKPTAVLATLAIATSLGISVMKSHSPSGSAIQVAQSDLPDSGIRVKGLKNRIELWQKSGDSIVMILDGAKVAKGDLLQIRTQVDQKCYATVISLDGRGNWTTHLPEKGAYSVEMEPSKSGFLPFSYQLDDAPKYEVFWLLTSDSPFSVDSLVRSLASVSSSPIPPPVLPLDARFSQTRLAVIK